MPVLNSATEDDASVIVFATWVMAPCRPVARNPANRPSARSVRPLGSCPPTADSWSATSPTLPACLRSCSWSTVNWSDGLIGDLRWVGEVVVVIAFLAHRHTGRQVLLDHVQRGPLAEVLGRDAGDLG